MIAGSVESAVSIAFGPEVCADTMTVSLEEIRRVADDVGETPDSGPVYVTRPGKSPLVLLTVEQYRKLSSNETTLVSAGDSQAEIRFDRSRMTLEEYRELTGKLPNLAEMLAMPEDLGDFDFDPPRIAGIPNPRREVDFSG